MVQGSTKVQASASLPIDTDQNLYSICYSSLESRTLKPKDVKKIVHEAIRFNAKQGITGVLCHQDRMFFQYLEGPRLAVTELMAKIKADKRHTVVTIIDFDDHQYRRFSDWSLLHVNSDIRGVTSFVRSIHRICERESTNTSISESSRANLHMLIDCLARDPFYDNVASDAAGKKIIAIGASAGGIDPLRTLLSTLSNDINASILIVLHLSPNHETVLDEILERDTGLTVKLADNDDVLLPGIVYLIPPNKNLEVLAGKIRITNQHRNSSESNSSNKIPFPIDILFENLAKEYGRKVIGVLLSGSGTDGTHGAIRLQEEGAIVIAQDPNTADFENLPQSAINSSAVNRILRPEQMAETIENIVNSHSFHASLPLSEEEYRHIENVLSLMAHHAVDFTGYRRRTIINRVRRRRTLLEVDNFNDYYKLLEESPGERKELRNDLLIRVTEFFRDKEAWSNLKKIITSKILPSFDHTEDNILRVWIPGCATGEEPYSLAIILSEIIEETGKTIDFKIFASDLSEKSLEHATTGIYKKSLVKGVPEVLLVKYFTEIGDNYHISPSLKERVIAVRHNMVEDAPFTNMHLACCRNLMIYLDRELQVQALKALHFSLIKGGVLFIGPSETMTCLGTEFETLNRQWNIHQKLFDKKLPLNLAPLSIIKQIPKRANKNILSLDNLEKNELIYKQALELHCNTLSKTALILNSNKLVEIVIADPNHLMEVGNGQPSSKMEQLLVGSLVEKVVVHLQQLDKLDRKTIRSTDIDCQNNRGENVSVNLEITEMHSEPSEAYWMVTFELTESTTSQAESDQKPDPKLISNESVEDLRKTLFETIQELDLSNHEQQDAMEQLTTANEELQSTNEELQSVNEELYTVNFEYQSKIHELSDLTNDMNNLMQHTDLGVIFVDTNLCIRRHTEQAAKISQLTSKDIDRPVDVISKAINYPNLQEDVSHVVSLGKPIVNDITYLNCPGRLHVGIYPYKVDSDFTQGAIITMLDLLDISSFTVTTPLIEPPEKANSSDNIIEHTEIEKLT